MQISTEITQELDEVRQLDKEALGYADKAKSDMHQALSIARQLGHKLDGIKSSVGSRRFNSLLEVNFDEGFRGRAKVYSKSINVDERQGLLSLGILPEVERVEAMSIKVDPFFVWVNKIAGKIRGADSIKPAERTALEQLRREIERALEK